MMRTSIDPHENDLSPILPMLVADKTTLEPRRSQVRVRLLGAPCISCGGVRLEHRLSPQTMLLFVMLVARRKEILSRAELAFALWPDVSESDARAALRRHLYVLQQALGESSSSWIACDTKTISWDPAGAAWVDVAEFERLSQIPEALESAANLYVGEFVPYLEHEWIVAFRERLRRRACRVLEQLIKQKSASGDIVGALNYTEELLAHDPWREDALRQLMLLRFRVSDRAGALAYYRGFRERLRAEFDVDPMPETVKCHEMILVGKLTVLNGNGGFEKCQG